MNNILKFASLLFAAVMLISCGKIDNGAGNGGTKGTLTITPDKTFLQSDGTDYVTLSVDLDGVPVTEGVTFYSGTKVVATDGFRFSTKEAGTHEIWANYGTYNSDPVQLTAIGAPIPDAPADPSPSKTDFKVRAMLMQFTGTACGYCSQFMERLKSAFADEAFAEEYVRAAIHNYQYSDSYPDPAYFQWDWASRSLKGYDVLGGKSGQGVSNPSIFVDYKYAYYLYASSTPDNFMEMVRDANEEKKDAACGISVNSSLVDDQIVATVTVKAAKSGSYRIGAMLLEDGLEGKQINGTDWMNVHNDCVRYIDALYSVNNTQSYGHSLGKIEKGETASYVFVWNLDDIWKAGSGAVEYWKPFVNENLRMAVFVTTAGDDAYYINNAIAASVNGQTPFEYR